MKYAIAAYAAAILLVGGLVTALTAPKHEEEEAKAEAQKEQAELAKQPPPELTAPEQVVARVEQIRGLRFRSAAPELEIAPPPKIEQQLTTLDTQAQSQAKGPEKQRDAKLQTATGIVLGQAGAISPQDAQQATKQYGGASPLGLWVPQQGKVLVSAELAESDPRRAELVYVHELTRALEAERFGRTGRRARPFRDDETAELAVHEGTAMLVATQYAERHVPAGDTGQQLAFEAGSDAELSPGLASYATFPSEQGARFVERLHRRGDWEAVDQAHEELPVTTREILHPDAGAQDAVPPPTPDVRRALGKGWQEQASATLGELDTIALLRAGVEADTALRAAEGWRAGHAEVWSKGAQGQSCQPPCRKGAASVLVWRWADPQDGAEFSRAIRQSLEQAAKARPEGPRGWKVGDGGAALVREGRFTALVFAPDAPTAGRVAEAALEG